MKHGKIIKKMSLHEKCGLLTGKDIWSTKPIERLGIKSLNLSDGPSGLRKQNGEGDHLGLNQSHPSTCWPAASALAQSWDSSMCKKVGAALAIEAKSQSVDVVLGPGLNIKRSPLCGRNFEYFSEDPYLSGKLAAGFVRGLQSKKTAACIKHFAANSQELNRMTSDSVVDERTLREIYLTNFEIAVKEGAPKFVMTSYNKVNGKYANENTHILKDILKDEWGYTGAVVSDWGGSNDHVKGVLAGSHLEMPGTFGDSDRQLMEAVQRGVVPMVTLDERVSELLDVIFSIKIEEEPSETFHFDKEAHHALAERVARECTVLLKNESGFLPLKPGAEVAFIGGFAETPRYQGAGSSRVNPTKVESLLEFAGNYEWEFAGYCNGYKRDGKQDGKLEEEAYVLAKKADVVIFCAGLPEAYETEGLDRQDINLPQNQIQLLKGLYAVNPNIAVILFAGSPLEMSWDYMVKAVLHGYLLGQAGAQALMDIISGKVNPSGKLAESYPFCLEDTPSFNYYPGTQKTVEYREGLYVGYRYYETAGRQTIYPFGHGLSYTEFSYSRLETSDSGVSFYIKNIGGVPGAEIAQMYIGLKESDVFRPAKELKGFNKVFLEPGEQKKIEIPFDEYTFRYYNHRSGCWDTEAGSYDVMIGASVKDIRLEASHNVSGSYAQVIYDPETLKSYFSSDIKDVSQSEFEALLGRQVPQAGWDTKMPLEINDALCQMYYAKSLLARAVFKMLDYIKRRSIASGTPNLNVLFIYSIPFRAIAKMTNGKITMRGAYALLDMVNGHFFSGVIKFIRESTNAAKLARKAKKGL